jgi:hypothetical protein
MTGCDATWVKLVGVRSLSQVSPTMASPDSGWIASKRKLIELQSTRWDSERLSHHSCDIYSFYLVLRIRLASPWKQLSDVSLSFVTRSWLTFFPPYPLSQKLFDKLLTVLIPLLHLGPHSGDTFKGSAVWAHILLSLLLPYLSFLVISASHFLAPNPDCLRSS